jgi:hypothetical protein
MENLPMSKKDNKVTLITEADTNDLFEGIELSDDVKADFAIKLESQIISKVATLKEAMETENSVRPERCRLQPNPGDPNP